MHEYFLLSKAGVMRILILFFICLAFSVYAQEESAYHLLEPVGIWDKFEYVVQNNFNYTDPYRDVELQVQFTSPEGEIIRFWGFYDGEQTWKVRFSPNAFGRWKYKIWFNDQSELLLADSAFRCEPSDLPGMVSKYPYNPFWLGYKSRNHELFRSFHVGDQFFADNWDDPGNLNDGEKRTEFLDWLQDQGYNMVSIASHYLNRPEEGRGLGWETPKLWPLDAKEYQKMEIILDTLAARRIIVFPFAGFFGARADWPTDFNEQELYIKYTLARIGYYWNTILSVAGPEPFWRKEESQYKSQMKWQDINRLGNLIKELDVHGHILTIHNEKRASKYGDPFVDQNWYDMGTMQGPTTLNCEELFTGLSANHHISKPLYAQETLWYGNKWHPQYSDDALRKNSFIILFSGSILNFADMNGNSSSGFSGKLDFGQLHPGKHKIVHQVWDFFETIPFYKLRSRQDLVKSGYCLAKEGEEYYVYLDSIGEVELFVDYNYGFATEWINATDPKDIVEGPVIYEKSVLSSPQRGDDWILHAYATKPAQIATGNFPDLTVDNNGNIHVVYNRNGLKYRKYNISSHSWEEEQSPGCNCSNVKRSDPDIVVDSHGNPIVFCGTQAGRWTGEKWILSEPGATRDAELIIDSKDNAYLCHRGGNNGGFIGIKKLPAASNEWITMTDADQNHSGPNDHVYCDMWMDASDVIHLVQRHGPEVEVTYRRSDDGSNTWINETAISNERSESPHIVVDHDGKIIISTGKGYVFENILQSWDSIGRMVHTQGRDQPEFGLDKNNNIYISAFGGRFNIRHYGVWGIEKKLELLSDEETIGFVETAGSKDFAYIIWEEGKGDAHDGLAEVSKIFIGKLFPDGRVLGIRDFDK
jgi:hypothetical protein